MSTFTHSILCNLFSSKSVCVDYAGGYGLFVRLMRDNGHNFFWQDSYCKNIFSIGFEYDAKRKYDVLTAFEVFEHLVSPMEELETMLNLADTVIFSTVLLPSSVPNPKEWWYYGFDHGQHISFYAKKTLKYMAETKNLFFYTNGKNMHIFSKKKHSLIFLKFLFFYQKAKALKYKIKYARAFADSKQIN